MCSLGNAAHICKGNDLSTAVSHWVNGLGCLCRADFESPVPIPLMTSRSSLADGIIAVSPALWEVAYICRMNTDMIKFSAVDSDKPLLISM